MIKHYFCEYCGKDFLSGKECMEHEVACKVKIEQEKKKEKEEAEKKADMDKIVSSFSDAVELCKNYMEKYSIFDLDEFINTLKNKLSEIEDKIFEDFVDFSSKPASDFGAVKFTISDPKFNSDMISKSSLKEESSENEIDDIIDKLSKPTLSINPGSRKNYFCEGKAISLDELLEILDEQNKGSRFYF